MARQTKAWQRVSCAGGLVLAATGAGMALGGLEHGLGHLLVSAACAGVTALPSIFQAAGHPLPVCAWIQGPAAEQLMRILESSWPAILAIGGL